MTTSTTADAVAAGATAASAIAAGTGIASAMAGSLFGLDGQAIMCGILGALIAKTLVPPSPPVAPGISPAAAFGLQGRLEKLLALGRRWAGRLAELLAAGALAGAIGPAADVIVGGMVPSALTGEPLHIAVATTIGMTAPLIVALLRKIVTTLGDKP